MNGLMRTTVLGALSVATSISPVRADTDPYRYADTPICRAAKAMFERQHKELGKLSCRVSDGSLSNGIDAVDWQPLDLAEHAALYRDIALAIERSFERNKGKPDAEIWEVSFFKKYLDSGRPEFYETDVSIDGEMVRFVKIGVRPCHNGNGSQLYVIRMDANNTVAPQVFTLPPSDLITFEGQVYAITTLPNHASVYNFGVIADGRHGYGQRCQLDNLGR